MFTILYNCSSNYNYFQLWFHNIGGLPYVVQDLYLTIGNPNIYDVMQNLNSLLSVYCNVTYDRIKNEYIYTQEYIHKIIIITICLLHL